ncbi:MAG: hypothetical protein H7Y88_04065 [Phycisphaerales bacterium]|nr:hypothetical protein [Phycisphaerales bacterium]
MHSTTDECLHLFTIGNGTEPLVRLSFVYAVIVAEGVKSGTPGSKIVQHRRREALALVRVKSCAVRVVPDCDHIRTDLVVKNQAKSRRRAA